MASAATLPVTGVDVSMWNRLPDWGQAQAAGVRFVIAKASQGRTWVDPNRKDVSYVDLAGARPGGSAELVSAGAAGTGGPVP